MKVVRKSTSRGEGNPIRISGKGLNCLVAISAEPKTKDLGAKVTLELH